MKPFAIAALVAFLLLAYNYTRADSSPPGAPERAAWILEKYAAVYRISDKGEPLPEWLDNELAAMVQVGNARLIQTYDGEFYAPKERGK